MVQARGQFKRALLAISLLAIGVGLSFAGSIYVDREAESNARNLFESDAGFAIAEIEREIERHVAVVEETTAFAEATWPGSVGQWRNFTDGRVTGGTHLAFSSTAGLIERVPADQIDEFEARETALAGQPFQILEIAPQPADADRLVLTRTGEDTTNGFQIRGLEITPVSQLLEIDLPEVGEGIAVDAIDEAPEAFLEILSIDDGAFDDNDILNTNVLLTSAIGPEGQEPLGWVLVPAELGSLLTRAIDSLARTELNIAIEIPGTELDGDIGRYEGDPGLLFADAAMVSESSVDFGGWTWRVKVWAGEEFGVDANRVRGEHVFAGGIAFTLLFVLLLQLQWRYRRKLVVAEFESELNRTLAETDPLTGLLNRQGLREFAVSESVQDFADNQGCTIFFLDLDGFKEINDQLGHAAGDEVLVAVSRAISSAARDGDVVGRPGGDEFVLVCPGLADALSADGIAGRLTDAISSIDEPAPIGVSIGISVTPPGSGFNFDTSLSNADDAMYEAKRRNQSHLHTARVGR